MHAEISGTVDFFEKDDPACLKRLRSVVALLPEAKEHGRMRPASAKAFSADGKRLLVISEGSSNLERRPEELDSANLQR